MLLTPCHCCAVYYSAGHLSPLFYRCVTDIPHFREIVIMAFACDGCGFRSNEIKAGGAVPKLGERTTVHVRGGDFTVRGTFVKIAFSIFFCLLSFLYEGRVGVLFSTVLQ